MKNSVKITVFRWAGKKWFHHINGECIECELTVSQVRTLVARDPDWPIEWEIKPWLSHLWESLGRGGWHPPVVLVDGKLVRQGTIPTTSKSSSQSNPAAETLREVPAYYKSLVRSGYDSSAGAGMD